MAGCRGGDSEGPASGIDDAMGAGDADLVEVGSLLDVVADGLFFGMA